MFENTTIELRVLTMELSDIRVWVVFEKRYLFLEYPPDPPGQMEYVLFRDRFEPYQRHVYQIPIPPGHRPQPPIGQLLDPQALAVERLVQLV